MLGLAGAAARSEARQFDAERGAPGRATLPGMKSTVRLSLGLITFSSFLAFTACGDDDDGPTGSAGQSNEGGSGAEPVAGSGGSLGHAGGSQIQAGEGHGGGGHADAPAICQVVGTLCHEADTGSGMGHDCHELGHEGELEACEEQFASCIGFCVGGDSGAGGAGGGSGDGQDPYCAALGELCHPIETGMGPECHEIGHEGEGAACAESFDECAHFCLEARKALPPAEGGAGAGGASGHAGGAGGAG